MAACQVTAANQRIETRDGSRQMHIIAFGDIHMAANACRNIPGIRQADLVLLTGDLTNFGSQREVQQVLDEVTAFNPRILAQFGNLDRPDINEHLEQLGINLHGRGRILNDRLCIVGMGGSNPTPFHTPSEFSEEEMMLIGTNAYQQALDAIAEKNQVDGSRIPVLLISHAPPANTCVDMIFDGRHVGSTAVRRIIELYQPDICVTGHIHEAKGCDSIGPTTIYNPGTLRSGGWVDIHITNSTLHAILQ
ncbi:MAG: serine/threonine protein phosphatase [Desulfobulbaceae bacterium]|nr:MAG: serine/threonine protein phosphatase [Desulfobulbaceae bacterium]